MSDGQIWFTAAESMRLLRNEYNLKCWLRDVLGFYLRTHEVLWVLNRLNQRLWSLAQSMGNYSQSSRENHPRRQCGIIQRSCVDWTSPSKLSLWFQGLNFGLCYCGWATIDKQRGDYLSWTFPTELFSECSACTLQSRRRLDNKID